jgi:hypothetical protein
MTGVDELTNAEWRSFSAAIVALRDALPSYPFIHTEPVRNPSGTLDEVRAYEGEGGRLLADVAIRPDDTLAPVRVRPLGE